MTLRPRPQDQAAPRTVGQYRLLEVLGRGGVGTVYRAEHLRSGRLVALKTLEQPASAFLPTIRREIAALAGLAHPGIVRVLDGGTQDGVPWLAMELVEGPDLRAYCQGRPLVETLTCVRRLCEALAYLHGEGLVHRDLKPDNVLVLATPVLIDFGGALQLASTHGREVVEVEPGGSGTLRYMAPEQLRGDLVDARADLYSLGCILYELLAGRPPFDAADAASLARGHLEAQPEPLSKAAPGLPAELDALLLRLLAKSPRERLGHADDVAAALAGLGAEGGSGGPQPRAYLYRPGLAGRDEALRRLQVRLDELASGRGGLVLLGGESGVGKSRLLLELGRQAERRGARVLVGECLAGPTSAEPLHPLRRPLQAVADRCRTRGKAETARLLARRARLLARYEPALAGLPGQEQAPEPAELPLAAARLRLCQALADTFAALAAVEPVLLLLDDLQWSDDLTLGFLGHLAQSRRFDAAPILLVGTYRTEDLDAQRSAALHALPEASGAERLGLGRLGEEAVGAMVGDMLALDPPPRRFVRFLTRHSEGNPFFVAEYLRVAIAEGVLYRDAAGRWQVGTRGDEPATEGLYEALPLPRSLRETVGRRLDALSPQARTLAEAAAVLGREMELALLLELAGLAEAQAWAPLQELRVREVLEEPGPGLLRFAHDKLREVAYERIGPAERTRLHGRAAEQLEARRQAGLAGDPAVLGRHHERAGSPERARGCYLEAAAQRLARNAHAEAEQLYRAALALHPQPELQSVQARFDLGRHVLCQMGRNSEAAEELRTAIREAQDLGALPLEVRARSALGYVYGLVGKFDEGKALGREAVELARQAGDQELLAATLAGLALTFKHQGRLQESRELYEQVLALPPETYTAQTRLSALRQLGEIAFNQGRVDQALAWHEEALRGARATGHTLLEAVTLSALGKVRHEQGDLEEALRLNERARDMAREANHPYMEATNTFNRAVILHHGGRRDEASGLYQEALELTRRIEFRALEPLIWQGLGILRSDEGQVEQAYADLRQSLQLGQALGAPDLEGSALLALATLERRTGELAQARAWAAEMESKCAGWTLLELFNLAQRGLLELTDGRLEAARARLSRASELMLQLQCNVHSQASEETQRLEKAVRAFEAGRPLFRGECWEDIPAGLRDWLVRNGKAGPPFAS